MGPILIFLGAAIRDVPTELQGGQQTDSTGTEAPADQENPPLLPVSRPTVQKGKMSLQKRQVRWFWALFSVGPPVRYAHSWRNAPSLYPAANSLARASKYSYSFACMRGKRGRRLRPNPSTQPCKFALCSCREGNVHHRSARNQDRFVLAGQPHLQPDRHNSSRPISQWLRPVSHNYSIGDHGVHARCPQSCFLSHSSARGNCSGCSDTNADWLRVFMFLPHG